MKRVLVCDDDTTISEVVALVLTDSNWEVYTIPDCNNMIERIEEIKPSIIFMDNMIPNDGGIVATQIIKNHPEHKEIPVIYFTANDDIDSLAEKAGADYTLAKPFNLNELEDVVQKAFSAYRNLRSSD